MPVRVEVYDWPTANGNPKGELLECYSYINLRFNLGLTDAAAVCGIVDAIVRRDLPAALRSVQEVTAKGSDLRQFTRVFQRVMKVSPREYQRNVAATATPRRC